MKRELHIFLTALSFYTRIPVPQIQPFKEEYLSLAIKYFPVIGWIVGSVSALVFISSNQVFDSSISVLFAVVAGVLITGAFHEDGFADVCDGFGGGWSKEKILEIMKDSRLGTYGVIGLISILSIKFMALQELITLTFKNSTELFLLFIIPHSISRFFSASMIFTHEYAGISTGSKSSGAVEKVKSINLLIAFLFAIIPLLILVYLTHQPIFLLILLLYFVNILLGRYFYKRIGGYTGDCLGAVQQVTEILTYISLIILWRFI